MSHPRVTACEETKGGKPIFYLNRLMVNRLSLFLAASDRLLAC